MALESDPTPLEQDQVLYKYLHTRPIAGVPYALLILQTMRLTVSDPTTFNDPFEVRPCFDQECHDHYAKGKELFTKEALGLEHCLVAGQSMVGFRTENAADFGDKLNERFREELRARFRVLCLSQNPKSVLMWGHYTSSHSGLVVGLDASLPGFPKGLKAEGFKVDYSPERSKTRLPLAFYQHPPVESMDLISRELVNSPSELVQIDGKIWAPFSVYRERVEDAVMTCLTTKAQDWQYEEEVRYIYALNKHRDQLLHEHGRCFLNIPPGALREIIIGFRTEPHIVKGVIELFRNGKIGKPRLFFATCHPFLYEVQAHEESADYIDRYFALNMASH